MLGGINELCEHWHALRSVRGKENRAVLHSLSEKKILREKNPTETFLYSLFQVLIYFLFPSECNPLHEVFFLLSPYCTHGV